jgi:hypothetical protein
MARRKPGLVGTVRPVAVMGLPGTTGSTVITQPERGIVAPPGTVALLSDDPLIDFIAMLNTDGAKPSAGGPTARHRRTCPPHQRPRIQGA